MLGHWKRVGSGVCQRKGVGSEVCQRRRVGGGVCQRKGASRAVQESEHLSRAVGELQSVSASTVQSVEVDTVSLGCTRPASPGIRALQRFFLSDTSHKDIIADL